MRHFSQRQLFSAGLLALLGCVWGAPVWGAAEIAVPDTLVPGRQREQEVLPPAPKASPKAAPSLVPEALAPAAAKDVFLTLAEVRVEGATVFPAGTFDDLWIGEIGNKIPLTRVFEIAQKITELYAQKGYALSYAMVPVQKIEDGKVTIRVIEGYVDRIVFTGDKTDGLFALYGDGPKSEGPSVAEDMANRILASRPLTNAALERYLLLLNDLPGVKAAASFAPASDVPDASVLTIDVKRQPISARASLDNRASRDMRRWTEGGSATLNGLFNGTDALTVAAHCGLDCHIYSDWYANGSSFVGTDGLQVNLGGAGSTSYPPTTFYKTLDFQGQDSSFFAGAAYPLIRSRQDNVTLGGTMTLHDSETKTFAGALTRDKVRTLEAYGSWDFADITQASSLIRLGVTQGLPGLGATADDDPLRSRANGTADFTNVTLRAVRNQPLGAFAADAGAWSLYTDLLAQIAATGPLLSAARCSYGGASFGRGYDGGALAGDHCLMGLAELRRDDRLFDLVPLQSYAFIDGGGVWQRGPLLSDEQRSLGAASTGFGVRLGSTDWAQSDFQIAFPLRRTLAESQKAGPRLFLSVSLKY